MANTTDRTSYARGAWLLSFMIAALLALVSACAGDDETPPGLYTEPCDENTTCAQGLMCLPGINQCTQLCMTSQECRMNLGSPTSICQVGACYEPCSPTSPCSNGLQCRFATTTEGTCRPR